MKVEKFSSYLSDTVDTINLLYKHKLFGQMLIIMYSAIDSFGLFDSRLSNNKAKGETFKNWVEKYILKNSKVNASPIDLWSNRCGLLHTHTSKSDLSNNNKAKEIQYFSGNRKDPKMINILRTTPLIGSKNNIPIIIEELIESFCDGLINFESNFKEKVKVDNAWMNRVNEVLSKRQM